jgi:hypothetical protein
MARRIEVTAARRNRAEETWPSVVVRGFEGGGAPPTVFQIPAPSDGAGSRSSPEAIARFDVVTPALEVYSLRTGPDGLTRTRHADSANTSRGHGWCRALERKTRYSSMTRCSATRRIGESGLYARSKSS